MATISKELVKMLNEQINAELESAYLYLGMANYYAMKGLMGFKNNFDKQAKEEMEHAEKIRQYLVDNSKELFIKDIHAPKEVYTSLKDPLVKQLEHEEYVTSLIYKLMEEATNEKDYRTMNFLNWFIDEQAEEENSARTLLEEFEVFGEDLTMLYKIDKKLGER